MSNYYDPYKVLQVNYTADLDTIRESFKRLALIHHPDRGGNPQNFNLCKRAYTDIYKYKKQQEQQLKQEQRNLTQVKMERTQSFAPKLDKRQVKQVQRNFNRIFENVRVENANDQGYGHIMEQSSKNRDDNPRLSKEKEFKKKQLVIYEEPEGLPTIKENYEVLGEHKIKNFGNQAKGYTDYMEAHSGDSIKELENLDNVRNKPKYKSIDQLQSARSNISHKMTPQEQMKYQMKLEREKEMEEKRKMRFYQHVQTVEKKFNSIHNYLTH